MCLEPRESRGSAGPDADRLTERQAKGLDYVLRTLGRHGGVLSGGGGRCMDRLPLKKALALG